MIVPMKKVSLIILKSEKEKALKKLRRLGLLHIEITEGEGERLFKLNEQISLLESAIFSVNEKAKKNIIQKEAAKEEALDKAQKILNLTNDKKVCDAEANNLQRELDRLAEWGEINPADFSALAEKGIDILLYEMPASEFEKLEGSIKTLIFTKTKAKVKFLLIKSGEDGEDEFINSLRSYSVELPTASTKEIENKIAKLKNRINLIEEEIFSYCAYLQSMKNAILALQKEIEFETYSTGMESEDLSQNTKNSISVAYFKGFIQADDLERLKLLARENAWGLTAEDPTEEDNAPTKLKNNKFVSLVYPLTDFLGTVPGYFEYDISSWFLGFILIFFGIIFGDGGYGLLIFSVACALIAKNILAKKTVPPTFILVALLGASTILWGTLTCTWFGLAPEHLPGWLKSISVPFISNVYADKIWYPFRTGGKAGLTTPQNVQIFCFSLALIQLTVAHIKCALRNRKSIKILGDTGSILQLIGMFYIVLSLVVNSEVFSLSLVISGIPVGTLAIALIAVGFILSFVFANYEGSIIKSILSSLTNIVSILLGVVNVFSDIVSYIRLWAVGLAGSAISATVNELAGPFLGNLVFIIVAIVVLVFGHGLNMILNVLSVIVHGIRLNTLEFSSHLDMSWSGHKFNAFEE